MTWKHIYTGRFTRVIVAVLIAVKDIIHTAAVTLFNLTTDVISCLQNITTELQKQTHIGPQIPKSFDALEATAMWLGEHQEHQALGIASLVSTSPRAGLQVYAFC